MMDYDKIIEFGTKVFNYFNGKINKNVNAHLYFIDDGSQFNIVAAQDFNNVYINLPGLVIYNKKTNLRMKKEIIIAIIGALACIEQCKIDTLTGGFINTDDILNANHGYVANYIKEHCTEFESELKVKGIHKQLMTYVKRNIAKYDDPNDYTSAYYNVNSMNLAWYILNNISHGNIMFNMQCKLGNKNLTDYESCYEYFKQIWCDQRTTINFTGIVSGYDRCHSFKFKERKVVGKLDYFMKHFNTMYNYISLKDMNPGSVYIMNDASSKYTFTIVAVNPGIIPEDKESKNEEDENNESI